MKREIILTTTISESLLRSPETIRRLKGAMETHSAMEVSNVSATLGGLKSSLWSMMKGTNQMLGSMMMLGVFSKDSGRIMEAVYRAMMVNYSILMLYQAYRSIIAWQTAKELSLAAAESAVPFFWPNIPPALAAVGGFYVGMQLGSGDWKFPSVDVSDPMDRRRAIDRMSRVV